MPSSSFRSSHGRITSHVVVSAITAASAGLMFGYNIGVSGGVTSMDTFLQKFFPSVYERKKHASEDNYCKFDDQTLQAFTSSMYIAGLIATFAASYTTKNLGRKPTMIIAGILSVVGVVLTSAAQNLAMLLLGRIALGCGVGFGNQAAPIYLSEMAPARLRGAFNILFQLNVTIGILVANLVNYGTHDLDPWGWRLSLALAGVPALLLTVGCLMLVETPNSLIERGQFQAGKSVLCNIRGTANVEAEFVDLVEASKMASEVTQPFRNLLTRRNRPQLVISVVVQVSQQFTGINVIMFYAPVLFQTLGLGSDASLYAVVITGAVNVIGTIFSVLAVDRFGRRALLLEAGVQMFLAQVAIGVLLGTGLKVTGSLSHPAAVVTVLMVCIFVMSFAWSWGPLGWLIPSEIFPLETRSAGQSVVVCVNLLFTFIIAQACLSMLCCFQYGIFLFFAAWIALMSAFVLFFIPETRNIPIDAMVHIWRDHWFWKRMVIQTGNDCNLPNENEVTSPLLVAGENP